MIRILKMSRKELEDIYAKSLDSTLQGLGMLDAAVAGAANTKNDVENSTKKLATSLRTLVRCLTALHKAPSSRDHIRVQQQQLQQQQ